MSLTPKRKMTEKNLAAHRRNGPKSQGAVTPAGKARAAKANLLHGFYSRSRNEAMVALGESPQEYAGLVQSLVDDLQPRAGLQGALVSRMGQALWRMQRAERMQDGLAVKRVQSGLQMEEMAVAPRFLRNNDIYQRLVALGTALCRPDFAPSDAEIQVVVNGFGITPPEDIQELFPLLWSCGKAAGAANDSGGQEPIPSAAEGQESESARQILRVALDKVVTHYGMARERLMEEHDRVRSPGNIAALMAPRDENALLMQRMEDSSLRQLWRLTRMFLMMKGASAETEVDESLT